MGRDNDFGAISRRRFVQYLAMLAVGGRTLLDSRDARAALYAARETGGATAEWPEMTYRTLGRTEWNASRLVFGCGAALMFRPKDALLNAAHDAGVNVFDVGYRGYYREAEANLAPFLTKVRDSIFLISKAPAEVDGLGNGDRVTSAQARAAAAMWGERLDASLAELGVDHVDAYYLMASYNPSLIESDEIYEVFQAAKQAGKVTFLGLSTHRNAERVLLSAAAASRYDLAMIGITPGGWYDWENKSVLAGSKPMPELRPVLEEARAAGMGLIGMKAARHISGVPILGWWKKLEAFDQYYDEKLRAAPLSPFQRTYAYVLEHGLDAVNADMGSLAHLQENTVAAATSPSYFA